MSQNAPYINENRIFCHTEGVYKIWFILKKVDFNFCWFFQRFFVKLLNFQTKFKIFKKITPLQFFSYICFKVCSFKRKKKNFFSLAPTGDINVLKASVFQLKLLITSVQKALSQFFYHQKMYFRKPQKSSEDTIHEK